MNRTFSLPFHSLSLLLLGITAGLVYTNYSVVQNQGKAVHGAQLTQTQQHIGKHTDAGRWANKGGFIHQELVPDSGFCANGKFNPGTLQHNGCFFYKEE